MEDKNKKFINNITPKKELNQTYKDHNKKQFNLILKKN